MSRRTVLLVTVGTVTALGAAAVAQQTIFSARPKPSPAVQPGEQEQAMTYEQALALQQQSGQPLPGLEPHGGQSPNTPPVAVDPDGNPIGPGYPRANNSRNADARPEPPANYGSAAPDNTEPETIGGYPTQMPGPNPNLNQNPNQNQGSAQTYSQPRAQGYAQGSAQPGYQQAYPQQQGSAQQSYPQQNYQQAYAQPSQGVSPYPSQSYGYAPGPQVIQSQPLVVQAPPQVIAGAYPPYPPPPPAYVDSYPYSYPYPYSVGIGIGFGGGYYRGGYRYPAGYVRAGGYPLGVRGGYPSTVRAGYPGPVRGGYVGGSRGMDPGGSAGGFRGGYPSGGHSFSATSRGGGGSSHGGGSHGGGGRR